MIWNRFFNFLTLGVCAVVLLGSVSIGVSRHTLMLVSPSQATKYLLVEPGDGLLRIAYKAKSQGLIARPWHFVSATKLMDMETRLKAGEYAIAGRSPLHQIIEKIASGDVFYRKFVVPEGLSVAQVETLLLAAPGLNWAGYEPPEEGSLLPETYFYKKGDKTQALVIRMQENMRSLLLRLWDNREDGLPIETMEDALILASIVEKETGLADERALVAAVFVNRLRRRMRLQSDPTVVYGITRGQPLGRGLSGKDLRQETAYNTYRVGGLPPTPIANPGSAAIAAVLAPANVEFLYFVADGNGGHAFASTLREHNRNVARWRRIRNAQN